MAEPRICPHCGSDRWKVERLDKVEAVARLRASERERLARENGLLRANLVLAEAEGDELRRAMQRKIQRQARAIVRLEQRILALGKQPHEGEHPSTAVTVSGIPEISE